MVLRRHHGRNRKGQLVVMMDGDSLDEEDDDIIGPDADDLKAAEEDLADMDD